MPDKLKEIPEKVLGWWNKFTSRQKTIIIAIVAAVIFTFAILIYIFTREDYTELGTYDTATAAKIVSILESADVKHRESPDATTIEVLTSDLSKANMAIASEGYNPAGLPKLDDYVSQGMSVTSTDRQNQYKAYLEAYMKAMFSSVSSIKEIEIMLNLATNSGRLIETQQESFVEIQLTVTDDFTASNAKAMARAAATCVGNPTTANITITDQNMNILFAGGDDYTDMGIASSIQELQSQAQLKTINQVKQVLLGTMQFDTISVAAHVAVDYTSYQRQVKEYYANAGRDEGMITEEDTFNSESSGSVVGVPGTDSNGEDNTGYVFSGGDGGESSSSETHVVRQPNISDTVYVNPSGSINYEDSSVSVSMIRYRVYNESSVRAQGLLDGITWEEFKEAHRESVRREVDEEYYQMVAHASGVSADHVTIIAYEEPLFYDKEGFSVSVTDVVSIVMIILILALLAFVILRSMGPRKKAAEEEEELSVEDMLQSTPEPTVSDIDTEVKSETRQMVEKFVDENPEAAASLLRNWLNEDWA